MIHSSTLASSGSGAGFYSSAAISVSLDAGTYYMIGAAWSGAATYYRGVGTDPAFGSYEGFVLQSGYPSPSTLSNPSAYNEAYRFRLTSQQAADYASPGTLTSMIVAPGPLNAWDTLTFNTTTPTDTSVTVDILPATGSTPITGYAGLSSPADISGIVEPAIRLRANLGTTDPGETPVLHDWTVQWQATIATNIESDFSNVESSTQWSAIHVIVTPDTWNVGPQSLDFVGESGTFTVTNDGTVAEDFTITAGDGSSGWTVENNVGVDAFKVEADIGDDGSYELVLSTSEQTLATDVSASGTETLGLRYSAPSSDTVGGGVDQSFTVTVTASEALP